ELEPLARAIPARDERALGGADEQQRIAGLHVDGPNGRHALLLARQHTPRPGAPTRAVVGFADARAPDARRRHAPDPDPPRRGRRGRAPPLLRPPRRQAVAARARAGRAHRRVDRRAADRRAVVEPAHARRRLRRAAGLAPRLHDGLREIDCGQLEGMIYPEIRERYPEMYAEWRARLAHTRFPGGESYVELHARVTAVAAEIRAAHAKAAVAIVAHGGVTRALLADALGLGAEALFRLDQSYAGVSVIDYYSETAVVRVMNATP